MEVKDRAAYQSLMKKCDYLVYALQPKDILPSLFSRGLISITQMQEIQLAIHQSGPAQGSLKLLGMLMSNGSKEAFETFLDVLQNQSHLKYLVPELQSEYERQKSSLLEQTREQQVMIEDQVTSGAANGEETPSQQGLYSLVKADPLATAVELQDNEEKLIIETYDIQIEFNILFTTVLENLKVDVRSFVQFLKGMPGYGGKPLFHTELSKLAKASDLDDVFEIVRDRCSWFNHSLVKQIIEKYCKGNEKVETAHKEYCTHLQTYCRQRVSECPLKNKFGSGGKEDVKMVMKVDRGWDNIRIEQLEEVVFSVARILNVERRVLMLLSVQQGCAQLILLIPSYLPDAVFPLTAQQEASMVEIGVTDLQCGSYHFSQQEDAPSQGLPRALPGLEKVKVESIKEGTQYQSKGFQAPPQLPQDMAEQEEDSKPCQPEDSKQPDGFYVGQCNAWAWVESFNRPVGRQQEPAGKPNMTPDQLKKIIFKRKTTITAGLVIVSGLPSSRKKALLPKLLREQFHVQSEDLKKVEQAAEFSLFELAAIQNKETPTWQWYPAAKCSGYLSCFVSALESDKDQVSEKVFSLQHYKQYIFDNDVLDNYFHVIYQLLTSLYNGNSNTTRDQLAGGASLFLVNVWDIGLNRAVLRFLTILGGYLHRSFPILTLSLANDSKRLHEKINTSDRSEFKDSEPLLHLFSRASFLLQFSHLGRSVHVPADQEREKVSQIVAIADTHNKPAEEEYKQLQDNISKTAKEVGVEALLHDSPWIVDPDDPDDLKALKENVDKLIEKEEWQEPGLPLSWIFLRSAFFKTGQLYIKKEELKECAKKCQISDESFERFLREFTGFGSIIHIPDIPVLSNYVILNPVDFFHKLSELFYPRFNGNLKYGIASLSTMRRMFGGDLQFFCDILTACNFAVEIDSNRIEHDDTHLPIDEKCLFIPGIRTEELAGNVRSGSLLLVYDRSQPVYITANLLKFLVQEVPTLSLLTCEYYNVTKFHYYPRQSSVASNYTVTLEMIAHADKNEIRVTNDEDNEEGTTDIKKEIIRAYIHAIDSYKERHKKLLKCDAELEFALACSSNPTQHHFLSARGQLCEVCEEDDTFVKLWKCWKKLIEEEKPTQ